MDNIPAFPSYTDQRHQGMTLRDYFAGQAMIGILAMYPNPGEDYLSERCYRYSDAMLTERSKDNG